MGISGVPFNLKMSTVEVELNRLVEQYHMPVDPTAYIWQISVGEQQRVEILKLLYRGAEVLILDEPTAVLTPQESEELGHTLRRMAGEGKAIIFISHKLDEVMAFSDRVTVLRDGKNVATLNIGDTNKTDLAQLMVGREVLLIRVPQFSSSTMYKPSTIKDCPLCAASRSKFEVVRSWAWPVLPEMDSVSSPKSSRVYANRWEARSGSAVTI
jgi:ABC-type uncharacterized transport system ATPase subunit